MYLFDTQGRRHKIKHLNWVEQVTKLKRKSGSSPWPVIEECFNFWASHRPTEYRSFIVSIDDVRETRKDQKFGTTPQQSYRYKLDFPEEVMMYIRCIYNVDELPMDKYFFAEFWKRYPKMRIAEKQ